MVPGLPVVGNLLQLKDKKPYKTFTKWAEKYGPIYSIRTGASTVVVLNTTDVAKEVPFFFSFLLISGESATQALHITSPIFISPISMYHVTYSKGTFVI